MFAGFAQMISTAGQARATARVAKVRDIEDEMQKRQDLAYDAERWPHCMDVEKSQ